MRWLFVLALSGCQPWDLPTQEYVTFNKALWDPASAVATADGVYVPLPRSGGLVLVRTDGTWSEVDIGAGELRSIEASPDRSRAIATIDRYRCESDDEDVMRKAKNVADCPQQDLVTETELAILSGGALGTPVPVAPQYNALAWSHDGRIAIAYIDPAKPIVQRGVVNLTSALVLNLDAATATTVSIGFDINRILFTDGNDKAVILAQNTVSLVDLTGDVARKEVTFDLTLDNDLVVVPVGVDLTPDGQYALISAQGRDDLYVLDLVQHSVNIVSLAAPPSAMAVDRAADRTLFVFAGANRAEILDHELFDLEEVPLDEAVTVIEQGTGSAVLWRPGGRDVYRLELATAEVVEFRTQSAVGSLSVSPSERTAVAFTSGNGMEILDLTSDKGRSAPYALEAPGAGVAFVSTDAAEHALILQDGVDYVYDLDLATGDAAEIELSAAPLEIGSLPTGEFYVADDVPLGRISFVDPATGAVHDADGFARVGLFDEIPLLPEAE